MQAPEYWLTFLAQTLLRGAGWLLLCLLAAPLLRRTSAARRALAWQTAFVGLILLPPFLLWLPPLQIASPVHALVVTPALPAPNALSSLPAQVPAVATARLDSTHPEAQHAAWSITASRSAIETVTPALTPVPRRTVRVPIAWLVLFGWAVGAVWLQIRWLTGLWSLRRLRKNAIELSPSLIQATGTDADRIGIRRDVSLRMASPKSGLRAPVTWGILHPVIMFPSDYGSEANVRCRAALLHELAHVQRIDWAWMLLSQSLCALYWCVPFVWIAARRLGRESESACDDRVLSAGISAPDYAAQIMEVVRTMQTQNAHPPIGSMHMARTPLAETRIRAILDIHRNRKTTSQPLMILALVFPALCIPVLSLRAVAAADDRTVRLAGNPALFAVSAPSSAELTSPLAAETPPSLRKTEVRPSFPAPRFAAGGFLSLSPVTETTPPHVTPALESADARSISWGPVVNGLQAGLRLIGAQTVFAPGESILQETYVRNLSSEEVTIEAIGGYEEQGAPVITGAHGSRVKVLQYFGRGMMITMITRVGPGEIALIGQHGVAFEAPDRGPDLPREVAPGLSHWAEGMPLAIAGPGSYRLSQEVHTWDGKGKLMQIALRTGVIPLQIANKPAVFTVKADHNRYVDLPHAPIAWGAEVSGLQAGLLFLGTKSEFFVGERVRVTVVLRNVSKAPILFRHQTSFAFLDPPEVTGASGKTKAMTLAREPEWKTLYGIRMTGVTFDMTSAPSADGPSRLRRSEIAPGQSVIGYYLTSFVVPARWNDGQAVSSHHQVVQPVRLGLGVADRLDTSLKTGALTMTIFDPDSKAAVR